MVTSKPNQLNIHALCLPKLTDVPEGLPFPLSVSAVKLLMGLENPIKVYKCDICEYTTPEKGLYNRHQLVHSATKNHSCPYCPLVTTFKHNLKSHVRNIHPEKMLRCPSPKCPMLCLSQQELDKHVQQKHYASALLGFVEFTQSQSQGQRK